MKRYLYIEYLGVKDGVREHLVFDRITKQEVTINHLQLMNDGNDQFDWTAVFGKMKRRDE